MWPLLDITVVKIKLDITAESPPLFDLKIVYSYVIEVADSDFGL